MASGFLTLPDGRCFAPRWGYYDEVIRAVAAELGAPEAVDLQSWLLGLLPGPKDIEHLGYGPWYRVSDGQTIDRLLDLRELTPGNQLLFCHAAKQAAEHYDFRADEVIGRCVAELADMVLRFERGEPPLGRSDLVEVVRSKGRRIGPGWTTDLPTCDVDSIDISSN